MSVLPPISSGNVLHDWASALEIQEPLGRFILLNFFEEQRISKAKCSVFVDTTLHNFLTSIGPVRSYTAAIKEKNLLLLLRTDKGSVPTVGLHFTYRHHLVEQKLIADVAFDEVASGEVDLKEPLGRGKPYLWATFKDSIDFNTSNAVQIRNLLGLPTTRSDYLYYFPIKFKESTWIPSVFDSFGKPPYRPVGPGAKWGLTRNLVDDSIGVPELLIAPLETVFESPKGYLVEPKINATPPDGWEAKRLAELINNLEYTRWRY